MSKLHNDVLNFLINYKKNHSDFKFGLRERNTNQRLEKGIWFQGDETYAFVGLYQRGGGTNRTKSFGLVFWHRNENEYGVTIEIVFNEEKDPKVLKFYREALNLLGGFKKEKDTKYSKVLEGPDTFNIAREFLDNEKPKIDELLHADGLHSLFITDNKFDSQFKKILALREKMENHIDQEYANTEKYPLNQILYGPPGTGKTYHTINRALEIIGEDLEGKKRTEIKNLFDSKVREGQIVFTTFHQSLDYEDFIEGIKPIEPTTEGGPVIYKVKDGIFKQLCNRISSSEKIADNQENNDSIKSFNDLHSKFIEKLKEIVNGLEEDEKHIFPSRRSGVILVKIEGENIITTGESANSTENVTKEKLQRIYDKFESPEAITNIVKQLREVGTDIGWTTNYYAVFKALKEFENSLIQVLPDDRKTPKNHVLIIDEINRGNVSQIFGELITLIEEDKRIGKKEGLFATLPYSKQSFGVPYNLYLIGTMNTADRSVEALDTALRRRFDFEEMLPRHELLNPKRMIINLLNRPDYNAMSWDEEPFRSHADALYAILGIENKYEEAYYSPKDEEPIYWEMEHLKEISSEDFKGINFELLLETINKRIEKLIDKDHCIGHSYFLNISENPVPEQELRSIFQNKIIPLLQEYFFGDLGKIELVIGERFFDDPPEISFAKNSYQDQDILAERNVYKFKNVKDPQFDIISAVKEIYQ